jgi:lambda repressor-like predicted transcriptional regulator
MKTLIAAGVVVTVLLALGALVVGIAFAQATGPNWGGFGFQGMMGGGAGHMGRAGMSGMMGGGWGQNHMNGVDMGAMHQWMLRSGGMHTQVLNDLARALDLTPEALQAELQNGKSLDQLAQEKGISSEQLAAVLKTSVETGLNKAVADGVLTQVQADAMLKYMSGNYTQMLLFMGLGMGSGPGGCHEAGASSTNF